jgi:glycosyltransferase involved in cell wall biosynthesis
MLRLAVVANTPPPYRVPIFQRLGRTPGLEFQAIFCSRREPNREWDLPPMDFDHVFLKERYVAVGERYIHNNPDVIGALRKFAPHVVVTDGFNPSHLYGFLYAWVRGLIHIPMTDGTDVSEQALSAVHRAVRRFVFARSGAFVSASIGGDRLYQSYGIPLERCFHSCLCIDNAAFSPKGRDAEKEFDFIFCGRMEPGKSPLFALNVALAVAKKLQRKMRILFVGSGSLEENVKRAAALQPELLDAQFNGFAAQNELPALYRSARIFLFPTLGDVWGVVANEACAAGLPAIVSPQAGVAGELVIDGQNGYVCELDVDKWAAHAIGLLTQPELMERYSERSITLAGQYTFDNAASGLLDACRAALEQSGTRAAKAKSRL